MNTLVYLAAPYSHDDPKVRQSRFDAINVAASYLMRNGLHIFSPISHTHPIALAGGLPLGWEFWATYDEAIISTCRALVVLMLDGWDKSTGVREETKIAERIHLRLMWTGSDEVSLSTVVRMLSVGGEVKTAK